MNSKSTAQIDLFSINRWYILPRLIITPILTILALVYYKSADLPAGSVQLVILGIMGMVINYPFYLWLQTKKHLGRLAFYQQLVDIILIIVGIWITGGSRSPFIFALLFPIIDAGLRSPIAVLELTLITGFFYTGMLVFESSIRSINYLVTVIHIAILSMIAFQATYFSKKLKEKTIALTESNILLKDRIKEKTKGLANLLYDVEREKREWEKTFESIQDPLIIQDMEYNILKANIATIKTFGFPADVIGKKCYKIFRRLEQPCIDCPLGGIKGIDVPINTPKFGGYTGMHFDITAYPLIDDNGGIVSIVRHLKNVTENIHLTRMTITDELTGLFNYRYLNLRLKEEFSVAERYNTSLSLVMFDVDNFKVLNDNFGHQYGDAALKRIGETIKGQVRRSDIVGRYGGDEFYIIMPHTGGEDAFHIAMKISEEIQKLGFHGMSDEVRLTVSGGISFYPGVGVSDMECMIKYADTALYDAKRLGGNKVIAFPPVTEKVN
ncbi:MAG: sensor domain-containing diguanylate cyclase [Nitrospirae bacterium]|nr:sensor domain-containing diguanylate cyclase [Nitrospirota bacterium]